MNLSSTRIWAVVRKEFREYRHNRFILYTMITLPLFFTTLPVVELFLISPSESADGVRTQVALTLLLVLLIPVVLPATIAAYAVIGERDQGTLEPVLTTPIGREEFLIGKAIAAIIPTVIIAYLVFAVLVMSIRLGAPQNVVHDVWQPSWFVAEVLFTPLLAAWAVWIGTAVSALSSDVRVAQQLGTLASLPALGLTSLMSFQVIKPTVGVAVALAVILALIDFSAWLVVSRMFDRERLITGKRAISIRVDAS